MTGSFPSVFFATSANWNWSGISGSISRGRRQYHPKLEMFEGQTLEVSSSKPLSVHVDGQTHRHDAGPISCIAQGIEGCGQVTGEVALLDLTRWPERRATMIAAATRR